MYLEGIRAEGSQLHESCFELISLSLLYILLVLPSEGEIQNEGLRYHHQDRTDMSDAEEGAEVLHPPFLRRHCESDSGSDRLTTK